MYRVDVHAHTTSSTRKRRRRVTWAAGSVAVFVVTALGGIGLVHLTHPRDEAAYLAYLHEYSQGPAWQQIWDEKGAAWVIAEGDRACDWLRDQPYAGVSLGDSDDAYELWSRWTRWERRTADPLWSDPNGQRPSPSNSLVGIAWETLCPATWYFHRPHYPLGAPDAD